MAAVLTGRRRYVTFRATPMYMDQPYNELLQVSDLERLSLPASMPSMLYIVGV
jgi:hypothetical protein